jgi:hypothetical protein
MAVIISPTRGRLQRHFRRWGRRWGHIAADSFARTPGPNMGTADSGQDWQQKSFPATTLDWKIGGTLGARAMNATPNNTNLWAYVWTYVADIVLQVQLVWYASAGNGSGLFFRGSDDGLQGLLFTYLGGGTYKLFDFDGSTGTATLLGSWSGPTPAAGETITLKVAAKGSSVSLFVNDTLLGTVTVTAHAGEPRHGLYTYAQSAPTDTRSNEFKNFRVLRNP